MIGPTIPDLRQAYTEEFPKDTGIRLLYEGLGPALVSPRIEREAAAGKISADAILGGSVELIRSGRTESSTLRTLKDNICCAPFPASTAAW